MDLEVLISCMHQKDLEILRRSRITTDALVINQADSQAVEEIRQGSQRIRMITTTERGLSRSRNMALEHAQGEICLLCDDDEIFKERYEAMIRQA
ncbi:MAG: glycosyltransferase, partial [Lachnospiraceae bacterium]|nr:glycosyltransferase [Lachnospiraceae bacterium]